MKTSIAIAAFLATAAVLTSQTVDAHADVERHIVVSIDGTKGPGTVDSVDPASPLTPMVNRYTGQNPDSEVINVHYPGGMIPGVWGWNVWLDDSVEAGKNALRSLIENYEDDYDNIHWTLIGYSQGAIIAGDIASEIDQSTDTDLKHRTEAILYSDPRQPVTGIAVRLPGYSIGDGITFAGPRPDFRTVHVTWRYIPGDTIADSPPIGAQPNPVWLPMVVRGYAQNHTKYPSAIDIREFSQP